MSYNYKPMAGLTVVIIATLLAGYVPFVLIVPLIVTPICGYIVKSGFIITTVSRPSM
jgi:hypothetical protein